jgi:hypothetical protein
MQYVCELIQIKIKKQMSFYDAAFCASPANRAVMRLMVAAVLTDNWELFDELSLIGSGISFQKANTANSMARGSSWFIKPMTS